MIDKETRIVPLVQADDPQTAIKITKALQAGGLNVVEVVLRTDAALDCLEAIAASVEGVVAGAGTVLSKTQAEECIRRGARFIVSPGLNDKIVNVCRDNNLAIYAGVMTPGETQRAWNMGLQTVKFFPAGLAGGPAMLKALSSVFRDMSFMPTGGVSPSNLKDYLELPAVIACGGSWLTPQDPINSGNFDAITKIAAEAVALAKKIRP